SGGFTENFYDAAGEKYLSLSYSRVTTLSSVSQSAVAYILASASQYAVTNPAADPELVGTIYFDSDGKTPKIQYIYYDFAARKDVRLINNYRADGTLELAENNNDNTSVAHQSSEGIRLPIPQSWISPDPKFPSMPIDMPPEPQGPGY
ncbi:MAG: hypothetical protein ACRD3W_16880, partial [Terriglobales bacterium]